MQSTLNGATRFKTPSKSKQSDLNSNHATSKSSATADRSLSLADKLSSWTKRTTKSLSQSNVEPKARPCGDKVLYRENDPSFANKTPAKIAVRQASRSNSRSSSSGESNKLSGNREDVKSYARLVDGLNQLEESKAVECHSYPSRADDTVVTASTAVASQSYSTDEGSPHYSTSCTNLISNLPLARHILESTKIVEPQKQHAQFHSFKAGNNTFNVDVRYSFVKVIGSGAYGVVISATDKERHQNVAIKQIPKAFQDEIDAKRILREIKLLQHFRHENIVSILDMMPTRVARNIDEFTDVYIVTDLMETDLHRIIYSKQPLSLDHTQYFVYQILRALKYIHSANVIHRDLKPSNILVNSNCDLKICDFGLARGIIPMDDGYEESGISCMDDDIRMKEPRHNPLPAFLLTEYVVTRWYRAPEIMLACRQYSKPVDIWSVGCIMAELLGRKPLFPGTDYIEQLTLIAQKLGKVPMQDLDFVTSEKARRFMEKLPDKKVPSLKSQFPNAPSDALDLLGKMLQIHPRKRITVNQALSHSFFASLHCIDDEPIADSPFDFSFEDEKLHRVRIQELIWQEVCRFRSSFLPIPPRKDVSSTNTIATKSVGTKEC